MPRLASAVSVANRPLAALRATALESLFQSWRGFSGRRYICSVYPVAAEPGFDCARAVVAAVRQTAYGAEIAFVFQPGTSEDLSRWAEQARRCGACEFHVHLLAETSEQRDAVTADLRPAPLRAVA